MPDGRATPSSAAERRGLLRESLGLLPAQIVLRGVEGLFPLLLAYWFGRSRDTDVLMFAWAWFTLAGSVLFTAFYDSALIPILVDMRLHRPAAVPRFLGSILAHTLAAGVALAVAAALLAWGVFALRYAGPARSLAALMLVPFAGHVVAVAVRMFFSAVLNAAERYQVPAWATGVGWAVTLGTIASARDAGVGVVPVAMLAGELAATAIVAATVHWGLGVRLQLGFDRSAPFGELLRLLSAEIKGSVISRVNPVVDQLVASFSAIVGAGTLLRYANDVAFVPTSLLQAVLLSVLLSKLSHRAARGDAAEVRRMVRRTAVAVVPVLAAAGAILYAARAPLLGFLFRRGEMDAGGVAQMVAVFPYYLLALPSFGVLLVLYRATVAVKDSRILPAMGLLNAGLTVVLDVLLFQLWGLIGIAAARAIAATAVAAAFWIRLQRLLRPASAST